MTQFAILLSEQIGALLLTLLRKSLAFSIPPVNLHQVVHSAIRTTVNPPTQHLAKQPEQLNIQAKCLTNLAYLRCTHNSTGWSPTMKAYNWPKQHYMFFHT